MCWVVLSQESEQGTTGLGPQKTRNSNYVILRPYCPPRTRRKPIQAAPTHHEEQHRRLRVFRHRKSGGRHQESLGPGGRVVFFASPVDARRGGSCLRLFCEWHSECR